MQVSFLGRLRNVSLGASRPLVPLFEAVANSIQSVQDLPAKEKGAIQIRVLRDESQQMLIETEADFRPVIGFEIKDNGAGFNDANLNSFRTCDSVYKKGGKGIGRMTWLKAFESVEIESVIPSNGSQKKRIFDFSATETGVENFREIQTNDERVTVVKLQRFKPQFSDRCPKGLEVIAEKIIQHFLLFLLSPKCPLVSILDNKQSISINQRFEDEVKSAAHTKTFSINGEQFTAIILRLVGSTEKRNYAHFCAGDRVVENIDLVKRIPNLGAPLLDENGREFSVVAYVTSEFLTENANPERTAFTIERSREIGFLNEIVFDDIELHTIEAVEEYLAPQLKPIAESKETEYKRFVYEEAPEFRSLINRRPEVVRKLPAGLSREKLSGELHRERYRVNDELKRETQALIAKNVDNVKDAEDYLQKYSKLVSELSDYSTDQLAEYVIHRKAIISLLEKSVGLSTNGKYSLEDLIHRIIYPRRTTSDDIDPQEQNLWLIDERLSFHQFLSSDRPIKQVQGLASDSIKKPDILVFNRALAYAEPSFPLGSVVIVEFKRPMRGTYNDDDDNPIVQVTGYINDIKKSGLIDENGHVRTVPPTMPFYVYIIADLTPKLVEILTVTHSYTRTPDEVGYFAFHTSLNAYIEVISYDKLIADAKKRNDVLFKRLNLPT